jgi:tetratricopeptide (TPR) repeat protein
MFWEAISEFEEAIILNPKDSDIYNSLAFAYLAVGKYDEAITVSEKAIRLNPDYADYQNNLGMAYLKKDRCKKAAEQFQRAIRINPNYAEAYLNMALALVRNAITKEDAALAVNFHERVIENLERAAKISVSYKNEHLRRTKEFLNHQEYEKAYDALEKAKSTFAKSADMAFIMDFYLQLIYNSKNLNGAMISRYIRQLQEVLDKHPDYVDLNNHLGVAYVIMSKFVNNKAIQQFEKAMQSNPAFERAKRNKRLAEYDHKGIQLLVDAILK